ncbi:hypothetical protein Celal_4034 [Cellulophaga algicola DSM 14237]|uniref:DUF4861 domain-containing protein n=1 Tax=Cellulophaga algicola (strain DSM 14237 / IC166 / ACAM 630) TaxID=688270 RepID=E6XDU0_CELAD|nr:DUF4861 family protein [Cellulophaga algicola]ADV51278.1 hypothetical protein Celal_4034 [Cellulophaga algicola DSM 14237]
MKSTLFFLLLLSALEVTYCQSLSSKKDSYLQIEIENPISMIRKNETITLSAAVIKANFPIERLQLIQIKDLKSNTLLRTQAIDYNEDGVPEEFLFQTDFDPNEKKKFELYIIEKDSLITSKVYATYMPTEEGMEDFTWENDFIGYRFYGQERALKQGTGIAMDVWCKRTPDFLTEKWYAPSQSYHVDTGYGADHYNSGKNQGCGGTGLLANDSLYFSNAFYDWKIIANGPIRTVFELKFTGWTLNDTLIETKRVTLDAGHYFNRIESSYSNDIAALGYAPAISFVQRKDSDTKIEQDLGWLASWESLGEGKGNLGTGFITVASDIASIEKINNHVVSILKPKPEDTITYYTGAAWDEFGAISSKEAWLHYIKQQAECIKNPCIISVKR